MESYARENNDEQEEFKEAISKVQDEIDEKERLINDIINGINKLKRDNVELRTKCGILKTQRSNFSNDILEMRRTGERINDMLETASKVSLNTSCEEEEYNKIIKKLEINTIFLENELKKELKVLEEELKNRTDVVKSEKELSLQNYRRLEEEYVASDKKVKDIDEKINELVKNKEINLKECGNLEEKLMKIRNENSHLKESNEAKIREIEEISKQVLTEQEQYQKELANTQETIEQFKHVKMMEEKNYSELDVNLIELNEENHEKQIKIEQLNDEHLKLKSQFEEIFKMKQELEENMQKKITFLKNDASIYSQKMQEKEDELKKLKERTLKIEQEKLLLNTQLKTDRNDLIEIEKETLNLQDENKKLEDQINEIITENEQLTLKNSEMELEIDRLKNTLLTITEKTNSTKKRFEEQKQHNSEELAQYDSKVKEAHQTLNSLKAEDDRNIANYMKEFEKITKEHTEALAEYKEIVEETTTKTAELEFELKRIDDECNAIGEENKNLRVEMMEINLADVQQSVSPSKSSDKKNDDLYELLVKPKKRRYDECSDSSSVDTYTIKANQIKKAHPGKYRAKD